MREEAIVLYGGECECCHEVEHAFLCFDHKEGAGSKHRESFGCGWNYKFLKWLLAEFRNEIRLLCCNCNWAIYRYGVCPHASKG